MTPPDLMPINVVLNSDPVARYTPGSRRDWIQSLEGRMVFPRSLEVDQVGSIEEIAHALAGKFRFTCQTQKRYSVAEHCVRGSNLLPSVFAGAFLLHELSEVYLPDIAGPLKSFVCVHLDAGETITWNELEHRHTRVMLKALRLESLEPLISAPEVKQMDWAMLALEKRDLCAAEPAPWNLPHPPADDELSYPWSPETAEAAFIARFYDLFGKGYGRAASPVPSTDIPF